MSPGLLYSLPAFVVLFLHTIYRTQSSLQHPEAGLQHRTIKVFPRLRYKYSNSSCLSRTVRSHLISKRRTPSKVTSASHPKLMPILDAFPSSGAFDLLSSALSDDAERKDAIKKGGAIFAFTLKNSDGETADWHIDLKDSGKVGTGAAPEGKKANGKTHSTLV